jgi:hypothetical protein
LGFDRRWRLSGSKNSYPILAEIVNASQALATLTPDMSGLGVIELVVQDGKVPSAPDTMGVTVGTSQPVDSDGDGLTDDEERVFGTNPNSADTDGDGFTDFGESRAGSSPTSARIPSRCRIPTLRVTS